MSVRETVDQLPEEEWSASVYTVRFLLYFFKLYSIPYFIFVLVLVVCFEKIVYSQRSTIPSSYEIEGTIFD